MMAISSSGQAEGMGFEPTSREGARFSKPARPAVSDYLP
jgi:hypothetical protein